MTPNKTKRSFAALILIILGAVLAFTVTMHLVLQFLNLEVYHQQNGFVYELSNRFDLDDESSISTWLSQALFLLISMSAALAAYLSKKTSLRRLWGTVALVGLVVSIDEVAMLHEFLLQSLHNIFFRDIQPTSINNAWFLILPLIVVAVIWSIWKIYLSLPRRTMLLFSTAIVVFLIGAVFVDLLASIVERETFFNQGLMVAAEEAMELLGSTLIAYTILDYLESKHGNKIRAAISSLK